MLRKSLLALAALAFLAACSSATRQPDAAGAADNTNCQNQAKARHGSDCD
jgi:outer membrane biogenesis lipoprotein LolB